MLQNKSNDELKELKKRVASLTPKGKVKYYFSKFFIVILIIIPIIGLIVYPLNRLAAPYVSTSMEDLMEKVLSSDQNMSILQALSLLAIPGAIYLFAAIVFCILCNRYLSPQILIKKINIIENNLNK